MCVRKGAAPSGLGDGDRSARTGARGLGRGGRAGSFLARHGRVSSRGRSGGNPTDPALQSQLRKPLDQHRGGDAAVDAPANAPERRLAGMENDAREPRPRLFERQAEWRDFAVLYRGNHQARIFEQALRNLRIPYTISGGQSFFDKAEIRDILSYLRIVANEDDDPAFIRAATTPRRGIGQATLQVLGQFAAEQKLSLYSAVSQIALTDRLQIRSKTQMHFSQYAIFSS